MHTTALEHARLFFEVYSPCLENLASSSIVEIGAHDVNGSIRQVAPPVGRYVGLDFQAGKGVDIILESAYDLPLPSRSVEMVVSSSCFEHSEMFWLVFLEALRILKPSGLLYLNVPSNGSYHRHPADCWRFYPDSGVALVAWAKKNGIDALLLESFIGAQRVECWNDFVGVFLKDEQFASTYERRILDSVPNFANGRRSDAPGILRHQQLSEDQTRLEIIGRVASGW